MGDIIELDSSRWSEAREISGMIDLVMMVVEFHLSSLVASLLFTILQWDNVELLRRVEISLPRMAALNDFVLELLMSIFDLSFFMHISASTASSNFTIFYNCEIKITLFSA